jgi:glycine cleavage system H protein
MIEPAADLKYTIRDEWVRLDRDIGTVGVTAYAAEKLGDVVFVDLPAVGSTVASGVVAGEIESTKSVGELFAPVGGEVVEVNQAVVDDPSLINADPFGAGWLMRVRVTEIPVLLDADEYAALTA